MNYVKVLVFVAFLSIGLVGGIGLAFGLTLTDFESVKFRKCGKLISLVCSSLLAVGATGAVIVGLSESQ